MKSLKSHLLIAVCTLCAASSLAQDQNSMPLTWIENGMYVDMPIYVNGKKQSLMTIIDTGTNFMVIDSLFACDSLNINIRKGKILGKEYYHTNIDSICFCGKTIRDVHCFIHDLRRFNTGEKCIIGTSILEKETWYVNRENETISLVNGDSIKGNQIVTWKRKSMPPPDAPVWCPIIKLTIKGKKFNFLFDTGATRNNAFPKGLVVGTPEEYQSYSANLNMDGALRTYKRCLDVPFSMGGGEYKGNFTITNLRTGLLGLGFLEGRSFILNYKQEQLEIF